MSVFADLLSASCHWSRTRRSSSIQNCRSIASQLDLQPSRDYSSSNCDLGQWSSMFNTFPTDWVKILRHHYSVLIWQGFGLQRAKARRALNATTTKGAEAEKNRNGNSAHSDHASNADEMSFERNAPTEIQWSTASRNDRHFPASKCKTSVRWMHFFGGYGRHAKLRKRCGCYELKTKRN